MECHYKGSGAELIPFGGLSFIEGQCFRISLPRREMNLIVTCDGPLTSLGFPTGRLPWQMGPGIHGTSAV